METYPQPKVKGAINLSLRWFSGIFFEMWLSILRNLCNFATILQFLCYYKKELTSFGQIIRYGNGKFSLQPRCDAWLAALLETGCRLCLRPFGVGAPLPRFCCHCLGDAFPEKRPCDFPSGTYRLQGQAVHHLQVPHTEHGGGRRGASADCT